MSELISIADSLPPQDGIKITINKEYFRSEFKKVFDKWGCKLANGMNMHDEEKFLNDLINTM